MSSFENLSAICVLTTHDANALHSGVVIFDQRANSLQTKITAIFEGLKIGPHGFHVHEFGDLSDGCNTAGPHFNPYKDSHGGPGEGHRHVGDMGNVISDSLDGKTSFTLTDDLIRLDNGELSVVGRSVV
jgi:Cu-Zn family superoxide dismutase